MFVIRRVLNFPHEHIRQRGRKKLHKKFSSSNIIVFVVFLGCYVKLASFRRKLSKLRGESFNIFIFYYLLSRCTFII